MFYESLYNKLFNSAGSRFSTPFYTWLSRPYSSSYKYVVKKTTDNTGTPTEDTTEYLEDRNELPALPPYAPGDYDIFNPLTPLYAKYPRWYKVDEKYQYEIPLVGVDIENVSVILKDETIEIIAKKQHPYQASYRLTVPVGADKDTIKAQLKNGVLKLTADSITPVEQPPEGRKIEVSQ